MKNGLVAQLVSASGSHPEGSQFEPGRDHSPHSPLLASFTHVSPPGSTSGNAALNFTEKLFSMEGMDTVIDDATTIERIAFHVNRLLDQAGMSRYRLAKITGESEQTIKSVADGAHNPRVSLVGRIAFALGVKIDDLLRPIPAEKKSRKKFQEVA